MTARWLSPPEHGVPVTLVKKEGARWPDEQGRRSLPFPSYATIAKLPAEVHGCFQIKVLEVRPEMRARAHTHSRAPSASGLGLGRAPGAHAGGAHIRGTDEEARIKRERGKRGGRV